MNCFFCTMNSRLLKRLLALSILSSLAITVYVSIRKHPVTPYNSMAKTSLAISFVSQKPTMVKPVEQTTRRVDAVEKKPLAVDAVEKKPLAVDTVEKNDEVVDNEKKKPQEVENEKVDNVENKPQEEDNVEKKDEKMDNVENKPQEVDHVEKRDEEVDNEKKKLQKVDNEKKKDQEKDNVEKKPEKVDNVEPKPQEVHNVEPNPQVTQGLDPLRNITKAGKYFFFKVESDEGIKNFSDAITLSPNIKNNFNYSFPLPGKNVCDGEPPYLFLLILSTVKDFEMRAAIRETWLKAAEENKWPRYSITKKIVHVFMLGNSSSYRNETIRSRLFRESQDFKDIILADFQDSYRNLSLKVLGGLSWTLKNCRQAQFVVKVDLDTALNVPQLIAVINNVTESLKTENFVLGRIHRASVVDRYGKWKVEKESYPLWGYPTYMYGHSYVVGRAATSRLVATAERLTVLAPEDAFLTGVVAKKANVTRVAAPSFTIYMRKIYNCELVWGSYVDITEVKSPRLLYRLWADMLNNTCDPHTDFRSLL
ncbi:uncharacterized protein LOC101858977 [Aplysia californica]|uniref:Uncharacterized protein LOC101858977 n=1 Tax=Aplysia californica TaxID=6500 RepID=A0ABM0K827_APLCA|nr:uncharacterized protein LOC101858977 [Aplysia californica]